jgi:SET domain-containing protein 6
LPLEDGGLGNPGDIVEVRADLVTKAVKTPEQDIHERVDWWLEEGGDELVFHQDGSSFN